MAFQQPARQPIQRPVREEADERDDSQTHAAVAGPLQPSESQTWVLFSPTADNESMTAPSSILTSLPDSQPTPGRSRLGELGRSDLGSLHSFGRSNYASSYAQSAAAQPPRPISFLTSSLSNLEAEGDGRALDPEDDTELDSLDSHLADFRTVPSAQAQPPAAGLSATQEQNAALFSAAATTVNLPTHDGLGSFRLGNTIGMGSVLQEHLYAFEQFNPRRVTKRRRESIDEAQLRAEQELSEELERVRRIEAWRRDHSRVLLDEIQKETRRRKGSLSSRKNRAGSVSTADVATPATSDGVAAADSNGDWHDQEDDERLLRKRKGLADEDGEEHEGLWSRITRKIMFEVMGIDDRLLSILFGEALPESDQEEDEEMDLSTTPKATESHLAASMTTASRSLGVRTEDLTHEDGSSSTWQLRMLERIARELGQLVHHHISTNPGAFSTFVRVQQMPLPYAGLPVIPEGTTPHSRELVEATQPEKEADAAAAAATATTSSLPQFKPTICHAQPMDIPGHVSENSPTPTTSAAATAASTAPNVTTFTQDEWEQDLDITLVFRYLRSRFMSDGAATPTNTAQHNLQHLGSVSMQDAAAKAARVRLHHPLVGRATPRPAGDRRAGPAFRNTTPSSPILGRAAPPPSCASQSTRRSARRSSVSSRQSSRHYWDIGGSGSMIASAGPMGSWGEL